MTRVKPVIEGGKPQRENFLVFGAPRFFKSELQEMMETIRSGWWGTGPKVHQFEKDFQKFVKAKHAVAVNSATAAMHLGLDILGVSEGDEVITTPMTFVSTANVICHVKAKVVFADVNKETGNIDPKEIEKKISKRTKAIIPVDLYGRPCDLDKIMKLAKNHNVNVLEDAAHATETWYKNKKIGSIADLTAFSFYVTKNVATGEGGMLTTNNKDWASKAKTRRLHGLSADAWKRYSNEGYKPYEGVYPGYKYNMMDIQAALGIHQLKRAKANLKIRNKYWQIYTKAFENLDGIIPPFEEEKEMVHARHLYAVNLELEKLKINRNQFIEALRKENIGAGVHFTPVHLHQYYRKAFGFRPGDFPNAEWIGERTVSLPFYPHMTQKDINDVIKAVEKILQFYQR